MEKLIVFGCSFTFGENLDDLPEIPKGPTKKVLYRELRNYYKKNFNS